MRPERRTIAAEVFAAGRDYDAAQSNRLDRLRNVEPDTAELLGVLVRATRARRVLEIGTSNGHSTLWLADAAEAVGGRVETLDIDPRRTELARANLERAELSAIVELPHASAPHRRWPSTPTPPGTSCSSTPSGPSTPATGPTCAARWRRARRWRSTTRSPTSPSSRASTACSETTSA